MTTLKVADPLRR